MYQPFFWGDYLKDTGQLSLLEHGVYMRLIGEYWNTGKPIPGNERITRALNVHTSEEQEAVRFVLDTYFKFDNGVWRHQRIDRQLAEHNERADAAAEKARKAAEARWDKEAMLGASENGCLEHSSEQCLSDANHNHNHNHTYSDSTPNHPTPKPKIKNQGSGKGGVGETPSPQGSGSKNPSEGVGGFRWDIRQNATRATIEVAETLAEQWGWDFTKLCEMYNAWVIANGLPMHPDKAFIPWMRRFTGETRPS